MVLSAHQRARRRSKRGKEKAGPWRGDAGSRCSGDGVFVAVRLRRCSLARGGVDRWLGFLMLLVVNVVVAPGSGFCLASSSRGSCWFTAKAKDAQLRGLEGGGRSWIWWWCAAALKQGEVEEKRGCSLLASMGEISTRERKVAVCLNRGGRS